MDIQSVLVLFGTFALLMVLGVPIAFSIGLAALATFLLFMSFDQSVYIVAQQVASGLDSFTLLAIPFFILAGNIMNRGGIALRLIEFAKVLGGRLPGALAHCNVIANMMFGSISGSAVASAAAVGGVMAPLQRKEGYDPAYSAAVNIASCPTGLLIPPSATFIVYSLITNGTSVAALFVAGYIPGILMGLCLMLVAGIIAKKRGYPIAPRPAGKEVVEKALGAVLPLGLIVIVMGGIYGGIFTPTEAAGIGAGGATLIALVRGSLNLSVIFEVLTDTARTTASLFFILFGALIFSNFVNRAGLPDALISFVTSFDFSAWGVMLLILLIYIVLGCVFESLSMLLLTVPVFFPLIQSLDFGMSPEEVLIWFGIVVVVVTEISLITPPVGLNIFVLNGVLPDVKTSTIFKGVTPFWVADIVRLLLLVFVSGLSLWMPFTVMPWLNSLFS